MVTSIQGNMFVGKRNGEIVAVDFGIMGRLDHKTRCHLGDMLMATLAGDYHHLARVQLEAGYSAAERIARCLCTGAPFGL